MTLTTTVRLTGLTKRYRGTTALNAVDLRFGPGITGLLGLEHDGARTRIADFVLSCRVMGRRVEEAMTHLAVARAEAAGSARVVAEITCPIRRSNSSSESRPSA